MDHCQSNSEQMVWTETLRFALVSCLLFHIALRTVWHVTSEDPDEAGMLRAGLPIRIMMQDSTPPPAGRFSRWRCVGNMEDPEKFVRRTCLFDHVCYDTSDAGEFLFFSRHPNATAPLLYDHRRGLQRSFRLRKSRGDPMNSDFVALAKWVRHKKSRPTWSPRIVSGPTPERRLVLPGLHALSAPFVPTNLGHVAWDEAFPLLVGMAQLGEYTRALKILRTHSCDTLGSVGSRKARASHACFSGEGQLAVGTIPRTHLITLPGPGPSASRPCLPRLTPSPAPHPPFHWGRYAPSSSRPS